MADWISTVGGALQKAGGLGLAGAQGLAKGLGLVQEPQQPPGLFGVPQHKPEDFSDLNPVQRLVGRFQDSVASLDGQPLPSMVARQMRAQQNSQRMGAYTKGIEMLEQFDGIRDRARPEDYDRVDALLRKRFGELAGGQPGESDEFYDTFMSGRGGHTATLLEMAKSDAGAQQLLASGAGMGDLRKYFASPEKITQAIELADEKAMPRIRSAIDGVLKSADPEVRRKIEERRQPGGGITLQAIREAVPELLTDSGWASAMRQELDLTDLGLAASPELLKRREEGYSSGLKRQEDAARISEEHKRAIDLQEQAHQNALELQELKNQGLKNRKPLGGRILQHQWSAANYGKRMEQANTIMDTEQYNRAALASAMQRALPNFMRSGDFQVQEQAERNFLHAILRDESGAVISESEFKNGERQYFPRAGDTPQVIEQKRANRLQALGALKAEAGEAWSAIPAVAPRDLTPAGAAPAPELEAAAPVPAVPAEAAVPAQPPVPGAVLRRLKSGAQVWVVPTGDGKFKPVQ